MTDPSRPEAKTEVEAETADAETEAYAPPAGGFGALAPLAQAEVRFGPMQTAQAHAGMRPRARSAFLAGFLPLIVAFFGSNAVNVVTAVLELYQLYMLGSLIQLACVIWYAGNAMRELEELQIATNNPTFLRWPTLIPIFGSIYWLTAVPAELRRARELHGLPPAGQNPFLYLFFPVFALQRDLNELTR